MAPKPSVETLRLEGGRQAGVRSWRGSGVPVVLLHGLLDSAEGWDSLCEALPSACFAIDLAGFGGSDMPTRPRISAYAEDVCAAVEALGLERFVLVGHSIGGAVATAVAERQPAEVAELVLLAPAGFGRIPLAEAISLPGVRNLTQRVLPRALGSRMALNTAYRLVVSNGLALEPSVVARMTAHNAELVPAAREGTRAVVAAGLSMRAFHRRRVAYDGPVTVLWGDRDRLVPQAHAKAVKRALPQADVRFWKGMGHHPQHERPGHLARLVRASCAAVAPATAAQARAA